MWARLQGVGISVRADTALLWPPPLLLHKTSQPALSPGLESVSDATCQIEKEKAKGFFKINIYIYVEKKVVVGTRSSHLPPRVTDHPLLFWLPREDPARHILCSLHLWQASSSILLSPSVTCSLPGRLTIRLIFAPSSSSHLSYNCGVQLSGLTDPRCGRSQELWLPVTDELPWMEAQPSLFLFSSLPRSPCRCCCVLASLP